MKSEITVIISLIEMKQHSKAMMSLMKIIENLLKEEYNDHPELSRNKNSLFTYLDQAKKDNLINEQEYDLLQIGRKIRNKESHELNVITNPHWLYSSFISCFEFLMKFNQKNHLQ